MGATAKLRKAGVSPQKCRLVADQIRGMSVMRAREVLQFSAKKAAGLIYKLLNSAVANAEQTYGADADALAVMRIYVDEGPTLKRTQPRAKGRANRILKRTSHVTIVVEECVGDI